MLDPAQSALRYTSRFHRGSLILARYLLGPDYRAAIAKADLRTFTRGNGVDRTEDDGKRVERAVIDKRLRSILSRHGECVNAFLRVCVCVATVHGIDLSNGSRYWRDVR